MSPVSVFRVATRAVRPASLFRAPQLPRARLQTPVALAINRPAFSTSSKRLGGHHEDETYEEFSARYASPTSQPLSLRRAESEPRTTTAGARSGWP